MRKYSPPVSPEMAAEIKWLLSNTDMLQHNIAAKYGVNGGRVSEVNTGKRNPSVKPKKPKWF